MPRKGKSSLSQAQCYRDIGDFWDSHDVGDFWDKTEEVDFEVEVESEVTYYPVEKRLSERIQSLARKQGVSAVAIVNLWVQEKLQQHG